MDERENLPTKLAEQALAATTGKRGSLVARGMAAVLSNEKHALMKTCDELYRQARGLYNQISTQGIQGVLCFGITESQMMGAFHQLATESYGKAYFPLGTLYRGMQSIKADPAQAEHYSKLAHIWLHANQHLNDPEIWHDLGAIYEGENVELAIYWFQKSADAGNASSMWGLVGAYEFNEDWENALHWQIKAAKAGHKEAQHGLEQQHEHGDLETKIDDEQVFDWYVWSAEQGHLWAQLFLAYAFRCSDLIEQDDEQAAHWYLQAATQGEPHAQLQLGKMYWEGRGVEKDDEQAKHWLEQSADQGESEAQHQFGLFLWEMGEQEEAAELIQYAADQEYGPAQYFIAFDEGITFDVDDEQCEELFDKAFSWYEERVVSGDSELRLDFALMHLDCWKSGVYESRRVSHSEGLRLLREVASEPIAIDFDGKPSSKYDVQKRACARLGIVLKLSNNAEDVAEAIHWLKQAADLGDAWSCKDLADMYLCGHGRGLYSREPHPKLIEIDQQAAIYWYERGFQLGWSGAAYQLGLRYLEGKYLPQNPALAEKWLLQAANAGYHSAQSKLGAEYASGDRLKQNAEAAIYWLKLAAEHLQYEGLKLAEIYLDGKIAPRNFEEAIKWLTYAAERGTSRNYAMNMMAHKCFDGRFNAAEESFAQAWMVQMATKAIETVADTKYPAVEARNLGELYELGLGVEKDMEKAIYWYRQSAESGDYRAQTRLNELGIDWEST